MFIINSRPYYSFVSVCLSSVTYCLFQTLVFSLVLTRLDYGNSALAGLSVYLVRRLQSVLRRSDHMTLRRAGLPPVRSVGTNRLVMPISRLSTVGSRAFLIAGPQTWNDLPEDVTSAESLATFRRLLKTHLFRKSLWPIHT